MASSDPPPRIELVDALRGFALLGIVLVNVGYFASTWHGSGLPDPAEQGPIDGAVAFLVKALAETKFYLLFSLLFGYSFTIQMENARRAGRAFRPAFARRLTALFVLGAAHAVLLFNGDILGTYALLGAVLLVLRDRSPRAAARIAATILVVLAAAFALLGLAASQSPQRAAVTAVTARDAQDGYRGSPAEVIAARVGELPDVWALLLAFQAPSALAMFLLGLAAGKNRLLHHAGEQRPLWRRLRRGGLLVGVPGGVLWAWGSSDAVAHPSRELLVVAADVLLAPALTAGLTATAILVLLSPRGRGLTAALAPAGRMALTCYLTQSLVLALVFTGYGAGLVGHLGAAPAVAIALALFAIELVLSRWWLARHRYGPLEWLLRWATTLSRPSPPADLAPVAGSAPP